MPDHFRSIGARNFELCVRQLKESVLTFKLTTKTPNQKSQFHRS